MNFKWLFDILLKALTPFLSMLTPEISKELNDFLQQLYTKAKATPNVWDDFFVKFLCDVLGVKVE